MAPETSSIKLILVDDHPILRQGLVGLLQDEGFHVVGDVSTQEEALALLSLSFADVVVVDLSLEHGSGMAVLESIRSKVPAARTVVYSVHEDGDWVRCAFEAGAMGYVTKREDPETLVECLRRVREGERFLSPRAARAVANEMAQGPHVAPDKILSPQELQAYRFVGEGRSAQDIASKMGISVRTVETYFGRILIKLNLTNRQELRLHAAKEARRSFMR